MPATCVVGLQWGDEAKGKIVDILTEKHDVVVRYQGGANAGHTVVFDGKKFKLSLIPSGIFRSQVPCLITGGVVLNPASFITEIEGLQKEGVSCENLRISDRAHVIMPWHFEEDRLMNRTTTGEDIGTTQRGIGPCYRDKVGRSWAIRMGDLYTEAFAERIYSLCAVKNKILYGMDPAGGESRLDAEKIVSDYLNYAQRLRPMVTDTTAYLLDALDENKKILFEGAQGALLDIDHGTFPYVTSSNSSGVGVCNGSGVAPRHITKLIGIIKAYTTRVGGGPFPTELDNEIGQHIRDEGNEYGTVTKRPRRCGWFDAVAARYTARLSGASVLSVMLLDVLSKLPEISICTEYEIDGVRTRNFPSQVDDLRKVKPIFITVPGWQQDITGARRWEDLPENARAYVQLLGKLIGTPVEIVSVGPDRQQTIFVDSSSL
ncbi:MAG: adenylosuccinate synthase [Planctomycetia bacterium]|nr:adenylosuccinate synthase [Planctomycetia bacterium]